jgi:signal transduction histidine kinase/CheY-like chemotaxis protein
VNRILHAGRDPRHFLPVLWGLFAVYLAGVLLVGWYFDRATRAMVFEQIDGQLRVGVHLATAAFPHDLRARAEALGTLSLADDRAYMAKANELCRGSGLAYLYAMYLDKDQAVRQLWSSDFDNELGDGPETWFGRIYATAAEAARESIREGGGLHYATYRDEYGEFRGAYLGLTDAGGRTWAIGADLALSEVNATLERNQRQVLWAGFGCALAGLFLAGGLHLVLRQLSWARRDIGLLAEVAQATGHAVLLADSSRTVVWANAACTHHLGIDSGSALGRPLSSLLAAADPETLRHTLAEGGSYELAGPGKPGAAWLLADLRHVPHPGGPPWLVCLLRDLSEHKAIEVELRQAREHAEAAAAAKGAFLANMSHEIRTPLNGMLGMTSMLLDGTRDARQRELIEVVQRSSEALLQLLGDILDLSKMEAQAMRIESHPCDVTAVVKDVVDLFRPGAEAKGLSLVLACDPPGVHGLQVDPLRLRQVIGNLVGNAMKFTERGGITVALSVAPAVGGHCHLRIAVQDSGIGIPLHRQDELFRPFVQVDTSTTRRAGGTGLGLAISRHLVGLMGGTITLRSEAGAGSTFTVDLNLAVVQHPSDLHPKLPRAQRRARVVVAEGRRTNRTVTSLLLRGQGVEEVEQAEDAAEAVRQTVMSPCALVLLDLELPGGAAQVRAALRAASSSSRPTPIIAVLPSGADLPEGYDGCLSRPVTVEALRPLLDRYCPVTSS